MKYIIIDEKESSIIPVKDSFCKLGFLIDEYLEMILSYFFFFVWASVF